MLRCYITNIKDKKNTSLNIQTQLANIQQLESVIKLNSNHVSKYSRCNLKTWIKASTLHTRLRSYKLYLALIKEVKMINNFSNLQLSKINSNLFSNIK